MIKIFDDIHLKSAIKVCAECGCLGVMHDKYKPNIRSWKKEKERKLELCCRNWECMIHFKKHKDYSYSLIDGKERVRMKEHDHLVFMEIDKTQPTPGYSESVGCICPKTYKPYKWAKDNNLEHHYIVNKGCELHYLKTKRFKEIKYKHGEYELFDKWELIQ